MKSEDPAGRVDIDPKKCGGRACVKGTRFTVSQLVAELGDDQTLDEVASSFDLKREACLKALEWAGWCLDELQTSKEEKRKIEIASCFDCPHHQVLSLWDKNIPRGSPDYGQLNVIYCTKKAKVGMGNRIHDYPFPDWCPLPSCAGKDDDVG